jgi:hypothetical protein
MLIRVYLDSPSHRTFARYRETALPAEQSAVNFAEYSVSASLSKRDHSQPDSVQPEYHSTHVGALDAVGAENYSDIGAVQHEPSSYHNDHGQPQSADFPSGIYFNVDPASLKYESPSDGATDSDSAHEDSAPRRTSSPSAPTLTAPQLVRVGPFNSFTQRQFRAKKKKKSTANRPHAKDTGDERTTYHLHGLAAIVPLEEASSVVFNIAPSSLQYQSDSDSESDTDDPSAPLLCAAPGSLESSAVAPVFHPVSVNRPVIAPPVSLAYAATAGSSGSRCDFCLSELSQRV